MGKRKRNGKKIAGKKKQVVQKQLGTVVNRYYKDTVFRMLFREKVRLLELYNAVSGKDYTDPKELEVVTLENAVYMGMKNDLAFLIDLNLHLYEHQSTDNKNMPLCGRVYQVGYPKRFPAAKQGGGKAYEHF